MKLPKLTGLNAFSGTMAILLLTQAVPTILNIWITDTVLVGKLQGTIGAVVIILTIIFGKKDPTVEEAEQIIVAAEKKKQAEIKE